MWILEYIWCYVCDLTLALLYDAFGFTGWTMSLSLPSGEVFEPVIIGLLCVLGAFLFIYLPYRACTGCIRDIAGCLESKIKGNKRSESWCEWRNRMFKQSYMAQLKTSNQEKMKASFADLCEAIEGDFQDDDLTFDDTDSIRRAAEDSCEDAIFGKAKAAVRAAEARWNFREDDTGLAPLLK